MNLHVVNSGSVGNCYILAGETSTLVIECGVSIRAIKQALNFQVARVAGVLVSHEHLDHCKAAEDVLAAGMDIYCSAGTWQAMGIQSHRIRTVKHGMRYQIGEFTVMPFNVKHDCLEPLGFVIQHPECGRVLFVTDSYYVPSRFPGLNNILVEANYCNKIVEARVEAGRLHGFLRDRVLESHMSIDTCEQLLLSNDLAAVQNIVLLHLSDGNSNARQFQDRITCATGKKVFIAEKNLTIPFNKTAF